jgi:uncharacterized protein YndB with AHSA1/START domain
MVMKIGLGVVIAVGVLGTVVALRPSDYRVARTTRIAAPPSAVFPYVDDLRKFNTWNPFLTLDPATRHTYGGPPSGPGATMAWAGDKNVGEGRMTVVDSRPAEWIRFKLEFLKPFAATADAEFTFSPEGGQTAVTWSMAGRNSFTAKAMGLVMDMDRMIGGQFEKGLASLKSLAEASAQNQAGAR